MAIREATKLELARLEGAGIIRKSVDGWASPAFPKLKKNGEIRLLIDYRLVNAITNAMAFPNPGISETLTGLSGSEIFTKFDLRQGYYQIKVRDSDIHKTGFVILNEHFEFTRMPQGLMNAPKTFRQAMSRIFGDLEFVKIYLDDLLVHSANVQDHVKHVNEVKRRIVANNISVNIEKSELMKSQITFLGKLIDKNGIKIDLNTLPLNKLHKIPTTKKQLQSLIGFIYWCLPHIINLSDKLLFLTDKLKTSKIKWTNSDTKAVQEIEKEIITNTNLAHFKQNTPLQMYCDASDTGIGIVLKQNNNIIGLYSKKLTDTEKQYSVVEKEMFAILKGIIHFRIYTLGNHVKIFTDSRNCTFTKPVITSRVARWKIALSEYDYVITHINGNENNAADHLSRVAAIIKKEIQKPFDINNLKEKYQIKDSEIEGSTVKIPNETAFQFIYDMHSYLGHPGPNKLQNTLINHCDINDLQSLCDKIHEDCSKCQRCKYGLTNYGRVTGSLSGTYLNQKISLDYVGPFDAHKFEGIPFNHFHILTITDTHSRFTQCKIITTPSSNETWKALKTIWIDKFGSPETIITDRSTQFTATYFWEKCNQNDIKHVMCSTGNPTCNGISERINTSINAILRMYKHHHIDNVLDMIHRLLNDT
ncbi:pol polyprotein [Pseudoloma neurophilia]|uniref:Pol polyprotein n=1 Tax=Pseudoloma neurophilia TaxID=146866 RepID=A0A0R0M4M9_9MICR|nr:pol polyprotein [Pseudoloma neurophilia]